jgi:hypothetical protein
VPVGYADGFRRLTGTTVLVGGEPRPVVGTVSMDVFAVELGAERAAGTPVAIVGPGVPLEPRRVAGTIMQARVAAGNGPDAEPAECVDPGRSARSGAEPGARPERGPREERL